MIKFKKISPDSIELKPSNNMRTKIIDTGVAIETINSFMNYNNCPIEKLVYWHIDF